LHFHDFFAGCEESLLGLRVKQFLDRVGGGRIRVSWM
jgi:hypothetical protein